MTILFIVYKATSELDFIVPFIWRIRKDIPSADISVLYGVLNKRMILRESTFYSDFFRKHGVKEYDLSDFIFTSRPVLQECLKRRFSFSYWDGVSRGNLRSWVQKGMNKIVRLIDKTVTSSLHYEKIFSSFRSDIIFFALRVYSSPMKQRFFDYTCRVEQPVVLYPQGAFPSTGSYKVSYGRRKPGRKTTLPAFAEVWYSFSSEITPERYPDVSDQFYYVGYPGLDREWLDSLKSAYGKKAGDALKCLFIIRKFVKNNQDDWVFDYEEFMQIARVTVDALRKTGLDITLIVKPHPSNDFKEVENVFRHLDYDNVEITYESIYQVIPQCDFAISISSTVMLVPAIYGLPTIFLNSSVKDTFERWEPMRDLFSGLQFYVEDLGGLNRTVDRVVSALKKQMGLEEDVEKDIQHFRTFYPDGSLDLCMRRLGCINHAAAGSE